ncbi:MAG TPA: prolyl oligopeptidase family serine peptidase [Propionibacteriaceae bacterium]
MTRFPETRRADVVEVLYEQPVADPYRWLEDPDSDETADWVKRQNEFSAAYLDSLPDRSWFLDAMQQVMRQPRAGVPLKRAGYYFVSRNDGTQNQDAIYVASSLAELLAGGRVLVDPNTFSEDGTSSLTSLTVSADGQLVAYGVSEAGSDWTTFRLLRLATGDLVDDALIQTKFSQAEWLPDHRSYVYTHFDHAGAADGTRTAALSAPKLRVHRIGDPQDRDELILEFPENDQLMFWAEVTDDDRYLVVSIVEGTENKNRMWVYPIIPGERSELGSPIKIIDEPIAEFALVGSDASVLFLRTDLDAEVGRLVAVDLETFSDRAEISWHEVLAKSEHTLSDARAAGDEFILIYLANAQPQVVNVGLDGGSPQIVDVPGGAVVGLNAKRGDPEVFVGLSSVTSPTHSYLIDTGSSAVTSLSGLVQHRPEAFVAPETVVERRVATSKDGTPVPYFLITPVDVDRSRPQPTLLYGYGGFKIPVLADYRPGWPCWLAAGGLLAIANLRGGGEFGTAWYEGGRLANKQNVFDDFVAVAEHLKQTGVTTTPQLALHGRSNGGLLVGAVMTQHPDLAAVAMPAVGVLDLLRFHLFTIGAAWISDYGNPDDPEQFAAALAYSPLHNVRPGTSYPATMVLTGDHDDRVVPLHSHKFTAALQYAQAGDQPILTRIEVSTGHGLGKPTALIAAEWADLLAFAAHHTGLRSPSSGLRATKL